MSGQNPCMRTTQLYNLTVQQRLESQQSAISQLYSVSAFMHINIEKFQLLYRKLLFWLAQRQGDLVCTLIKTQV